jgi:hypothetical protein
MIAALAVLVLESLRRRARFGFLVSGFSKRPRTLEWREPLRRLRRRSRRRGSALYLHRNHAPLFFENENKDENPGPGGASDFSPAVYCRGKVQRQRCCPVGTIEPWVAAPDSLNGPFGSGSTVPAGRCAGDDKHPGTLVPGYDRMSLRDVL